MREYTDSGGGLRRRWRIAGWGAAAMFILLPAVAMQVTDEVNWTLPDFVFAGALVAGVGATLELVAKTTSNLAYRAAVAVALAAGFLLIWLNGAVGIIGSEDNSANLMFGGVLAVAIVGAVFARFQPGGMARAMIAAAIAQMLVAVIALVAGLGLPASGPLEVLSLNAGFAVLWLTAGWLFRRTVRAGNSARLPNSPRSRATPQAPRSDSVQPQGERGPSTWQG